MTAPETYRYCSRIFTQEDMEKIREIMAKDPSQHRAQISRLVCSALHWFKPDGGLKEMSCRVAMLRMHADGLITLPPPRLHVPSKKNYCLKPTKATDPQSPITSPVHELQGLHLVPVSTPVQSKLWNEFIHRYHYLGYTPLPGAQLRYIVKANQVPLAMLGFGAAAWTVAPRDRFIGWSHQQRLQNLHLIVNNSRFLILPWVFSKNLASKILSLAAKQLPIDLLNRYGYLPVILETFVQSSRLRGTCYKAANWIYVGQTTGRGKLHPLRTPILPIKDIWLFPLSHNFKDLLCS